MNIKLHNHQSNACRSEIKGREIHFNIRACFHLYKQYVSADNISCLFSTVVNDHFYNYENVIHAHRDAVVTK